MRPERKKELEEGLDLLMSELKLPAMYRATIWMLVRLAYLAGRNDQIDADIERMGNDAA